MARNFAEIAFTDAVKAIQEKHGSRRSYERLEKNQVVNGLSENEIMFIADRDSFYLASIGVNGFPYIQHQGGPKGFLKVLDSKRIGFIDFSGNKQYISVGNFETNPNVALIMLDYPAKARLKLFAKVEIIELKNNPELYSVLDLNDYDFKPERMILFNIEAYDWNCPQHITPRYTIEDIEVAFKSQRDIITELETEIAELQAKLKAYAH